MGSCALAGRQVRPLWNRFANGTRRVNLLAADASAAASEPFLLAFRALEVGAVAVLAALLRRDPRLAKERGANGNTLLNLAVSVAAKAELDVGSASVDAVRRRCIRQPTPSNAPLPQP